jgi:peptide chain release factor subunit 1
VSEEALHHFKGVSERLLVDFEQGIWERLIIGCHEASWSEFESHLHSYVKQRVIGRFSADVASVTDEEIKKRSAVLLNRWNSERATTKANEALKFARGNGRGVAGLRRVLQALEAGEVQSIFFRGNYSSPAVQCPNCGHLDAHLIEACVACGRRTRELADVCDVIIPMAIRRDIELFYLKDHEELERAGNIAALLRFRSDKTAGQIAVAS